MLGRVSADVQNVDGGIIQGGVMSLEQRILWRTWMMKNRIMLAAEENDWYCLNNAINRMVLFHKNDLEVSQRYLVDKVMKRLRS